MLATIIMRAMEGTVKVRLLLTSALFLFAQIPTMQAQVTVDVSKITCEQLSMEQLPFSSRDVVLWLSGYYHREHNNTVIEPGAIKRDANNLNRYCYQHGEMTVMDAVKNMGLGK
jgi:HdeA/HdeB family